MKIPLNYVSWMGWLWWWANSSCTPVDQLTTISGIILPPESTRDDFKLRDMKHFGGGSLFCLAPKPWGHDRIRICYSNELWNIETCCDHPPEGVGLMEHGHFFHLVRITFEVRLWQLICLEDGSLSLVLHPIWRTYGCLKKGTHWCRCISPTYRNRNIFGNPGDMCQNDEAHRDESLGTWR